MNDNRETLERLNLPPLIESRLYVLSSAQHNIAEALAGIPQAEAAEASQTPHKNYGPADQNVKPASSEPVSYREPSLEELRNLVDKAQNGFPLPGQGQVNAQ